MPEEEDFVEVKFRLYDGSDIGPFRYSPASTVAILKDRVVAEWPKDKKIVPKPASDVKLISGGKILENNKSVAQCKTSFGELPNGVVTMHAVVQPSFLKTKTGVEWLGIIRRKNSCPQYQDQQRALRPMEVTLAFNLLNHWKALNKHR